jgi:hypothetical protein
MIEVRRKYELEQEVALMGAVQDALQDAFKIPPGDRNVRLQVPEPHRFAGEAIWGAEKMVSPKATFR